MKRSDFPKPFTTCLVDLNSEAAYADIGMAMRRYPRLLPVPYDTVAPEGKLVLEHFAEYLPYFKKIMPVDYNRMLKAIARAEEKGLSHEQAEIDAFYASVK